MDRTSTPNTVAWLLAAGLLSGCGVHVHSPEDLATAERARASFERAGLADALTAERELVDELLERELAAVRRLATARRNARLRAVIGSSSGEGSWGALDGWIDRRLAALAGGVDSVRVRSPDPPHDSVTRHVAEAVSDLEQLSRAARDLAGDYLVGRPRKSLVCSRRTLAESPPEDRLDRAEYDAFVEACRGFLDTRDALLTAFPPGSRIGDTQRTLAALSEARDSLGAAVREARRRYREARDEYEAATDRVTADSLARRARLLLDSLADPLGEAGEFAARFGEFADLRVEGALQAVDERIANLDATLDALLGESAALDGDEAADDGGAAPADRANGASAPPDAAMRHLALASTLGAVADRLEGFRRPATGVLLLESERLRIRRAELERRLERAGARVELHEARRDAYVAELLWLHRTRATIDVYRELAGATAPGAWPPARSLTESFRGAGAGSRERELIVNALVRYANSWTLGRLPQERLDYLLIAEDHREALDASETSLAQWENLIGAPLSQLVELHASGIRRNQVSTLVLAIVQAVGLGAIAVGVN